jgi:SAM-dependent methyltransferase
MGSYNQYHFLTNLFPEKPTGPVLEIGSKDYGNTQPFRAYFSENEYVGVDLEDGKNVDVVQDLTQGIGDLPENHFELVICCSILEHVKNPFPVAENIAKLTAPGGTLFHSTPWVWRYHPYPDDYWRYTPSAIKLLYPDFNWDDRFWYATYLPEEIIHIGRDPNHVDDKMALFKGKRKYLPYLDLFGVGVKDGTSE